MKDSDKKENVKHPNRPEDMKDLKAKDNEMKFDITRKNWVNEMNDRLRNNACFKRDLILGHTNLYTDALPIELPRQPEMVIKSGTKEFLNYSIQFLNWKSTNYFISWWFTLEMARNCPECGIQTEDL